MGERFFSGSTCETHRTIAGIRLEEVSMGAAKPEAYVRAEKRVEAKLRFYRSLTVYLGVNLFLFVLDVLTSPGEWWFYWVLFFWGIGVFLHFIRVFVTGGLFSQRLKERMIRRELEKEEKKA
jgi:hypothetical protein